MKVLVSQLSGLRGVVKSSQSLQYQHGLLPPGTILSLLSSAYMRQARAICLVLLMHWTPWACDFAWETEGSSMAARIAIMAMTTNSSIKVKAALDDRLERVGGLALIKKLRGTTEGYRVAPKRTRWSLRCTVGAFSFRSNSGHNVAEHLEPRGDPAFASRIVNQPGGLGRYPAPFPREAAAVEVEGDAGVWIGQVGERPRPKGRVRGDRDEVVDFPGCDAEGWSCSSWSRSSAF